MFWSARQNDPEVLAQRRGVVVLAGQGTLLSLTTLRDDQPPVAQRDPAARRRAGAGAVTREGRLGRGLVVAAHLGEVGPPVRPRRETILRLPRPIPVALRAP